MIEWLIETWGYPALLVGTFFEGETVLLVAGYAAHRGYLEFPLVLLIAFVGSLSGDQMWFYLGRSRGTQLLARYPGWQPRVARVRAIADRHALAILLLFRFLYGLRSLTPLVLGASGFSRSRFAVWNAAGAALWSISIATAGYLLGHAAEALLADVRKYEAWLIGGALGVAGGAWLVWRSVAARRAPAADSGTILAPRSAQPDAAERHPRPPTDA